MTAAAPRPLEPPADEQDEPMIVRVYGPGPRMGEREEVPAYFLTAYDLGIFDEPPRFQVRKTRAERGYVDPESASRTTFDYTEARRRVVSMQARVRTVARRRVA